MLNYWFSSNDEICPDNYNYSRLRCMTSVAVRSWRCIFTVTSPSWWNVHMCSSWSVVTCPLLCDRARGPDVLKLWFSTVAVLGSSRFDGMSFRAVYTGTRPGVAPAIRAGKGWRGRRELAPRCSATQLGASRWRISTETCVIHHVRTTTTTTPHTCKSSCMECRKF